VGLEKTTEEQARQWRRAKKRCKICREFVQNETREEVMQNLQIMFSGSPSAQIDVTGLHVCCCMLPKKILLSIWLQMHKASAKERIFFHQYLELSPTKIVPTRNARRSDTKFADNLFSGSPSAHIDINGLQVCCCILVVFLLLLSLATNAQKFPLKSSFISMEKSSPRKMYIKERARRLGLSCVLNVCK
jgi:hypothetical protein